MSIGQTYPIRVSIANPADLPFIERLRRNDSGALGFLSTIALAEKIRRGFVRLLRVDGTAAGFLLHGSLTGSEVRLFQLAVDPAFRGRGLARRLLVGFVRHCRQRGVVGLSLRCRERLTANAFWHAVGFVLHDLEAARAGALFVWVRRLAAKPTFAFHSRWHRCPACGRLTCDTWTSNGGRRRTCGRCTSEAHSGTGFRPVHRGTP